MRAVATLAGSHRLVVVEGAAGAGKTAALANTGHIVAQRGHRMIIVTPTMKAAHVAAKETGTPAYSAAWLAHQYGFTWDGDGHWARTVELAYASTVYGAQGDTTRAAHLVLGEHTGAASAYVAMTRGREANTAHLVAEDVDDARQQWSRTFSRNRADLGPAHAARLAIEEAAKYGRYISPRQLAQRDRTAGNSRRQRHPDPIPTMSRPTDRGPGIGF